jgi:hypothetical protein
MLAYGTSTGAVGLLQVSQRLITETESSLFGPHYSVETSVQDLGLTHELDKAGITSMGWLNPLSRSVSVNESHSYSFNSFSRHSPY